MRFSRLRGSSTVPQKSKPKEAVSKVKAWLWPQTTEGRSARITQYKDVSIFLGAALLVWYFEEHIRNLLEIDTEDLRKLSMQDGRYPPM